MTPNNKEGDKDHAEHVIPPTKKRNVLSHRDAEAASPEDCSVCGEEDPGSALESLVDDEK